MDFLLLACDIDFTYAQMGVALTAGTYILTDVTELVLPKSVTINPDYEANLLPAVTSNDEGKIMKVIGDGFKLGAKSSITGHNSLRNIQRQLSQGVAQKAHPLWSQVSIYNKDLGELTCDVVNYNDINLLLTCLMSEIVTGKEFDAPEAFYVFPNIKKFGLTSEEFATRLLQEEKVAVVPGTAFGDCGEGFLRISYAYSIEQLREAMDRIERFAERNLKA